MTLPHFLSGRQEMNLTTDAENKSL